MYYAHVKRLHSVKWRGLYGDTATMQELLLKTYTSSAWRKEKKSEMKLSLNRVWNRTAPSSASKVSLDDFDQGDVRRSMVSMYSLKKVLPTLDNIRTELKQSIGYTGSKGLLR